MRGSCVHDSHTGFPTTITLLLLTLMSIRHLSAELVFHVNQPLQVFWDVGGRDHVIGVEEGVKHLAVGVDSAARLPQLIGQVVEHELNRMGERGQGWRTPWRILPGV
jgi:hypothetical protein